MRNRAVARISIVLFLILFVVACKIKEQSELYGTYLADYDVAKEKLTLNKDGSFIQEVTIKATSEVTTAKGFWSYDHKTGYVSFEENFMLVIDGFRKFNPDYAHPKPGGVLEPADKYFGFILIGVNEGILYKKISTEEPNQNAGRP